MFFFLYTKEKRSKHTKQHLFDGMQNYANVHVKDKEEKA